MVASHFLHGWYQVCAKSSTAILTVVFIYSVLENGREGRQGEIMVVIT